MANFDGFQQSLQQPVTANLNCHKPTQFDTTVNGVQSVEEDQRRRIWAGIIEYQEKQVHPASAPTNPSNRISYTLNCQISCDIVNGDAKINAEKWPEKLILSFLPIQLIKKMSQILKNASHHIILHFTNDNYQGLSKLSKLMSTNWVGCIQFTSPCNIRMMIILYIPDKRLYMGIVPQDQEAFFKEMREVINSHKKEQQI